MIIGVNHIAISVPDLDRAIAFYTGLLGFEIIAEMGWERASPMSEAAGPLLRVENTAARAAHIRCSNLVLELFQFTGGNPRSQDPSRPVVDHGYTHFCLAVSDLDSEYQRLLDAGMEFHCPPLAVAPGTRSVYGRDPFGNVIELEEVEGRSTPEQSALDSQG